MSHTDQDTFQQNGGHMTAAEMKEHLKTWHGFMALVKWGIVANIVILALLAIFRTNG